MKYVNLHVTFEVPDDFTWDDGSPEAEFVNRVENLEGLCDYMSESGCSLEHTASGNIITEAEWTGLE